MRKWKISTVTDSGYELDVEYTSADICTSEWGKNWFMKQLDAVGRLNISDENCINDWISEHNAVEVIDP